MEEFHGGHVGGIKQKNFLHENKIYFPKEKLFIVLLFQPGRPGVTRKPSVNKALNFLNVQKFTLVTRLVRLSWMVIIVVIITGEENSMFKSL